MRLGGRPLLAAVGVVAAAVTLSGCIVWQSPPTSTQLKILGPVRVTLQVCASRSSGSPAGSCKRQGNSQHDAEDNHSIQVVLAFRLPNASNAPASFKSSATGPNNTGPQLVFAQDANTTREFQKNLGSPAGYHWQAYLSQPVTYLLSGEQNFTASADFGLRSPGGGRPFAGPFAFNPIVGYVDSGSDFGGYPLDDPPFSAVDSYYLQPIRDAGILSGAKATAKPGKKAKLAFQLAYSGATTALAHFNFTAKTGLKHASVSLSPSSLTPPSNSSKTITATIKVPKKAKPGTYLVTLTARLSDGEVRQGTGKLTVKASK